ncbi:MAG: DUF2935 domain-containing protein [Negativicutes bacterium]|nr:DUF2935 domain-containing protein [Negativicutes bacterium]MDR3592846.1 DUF2935 domain-containing protein [Negativicutes bacterium]
MEILSKEVRPYPAPTLPQIQFWLRIMKEHALFIRLGLPPEETGLIEEARCFNDAFTDLEHRSREIGCDEDFQPFVTTAHTAAKNSFAYIRHLLDLSIDCRISGGANYPLFLDHSSREALYFLKLLEKTRGGEMRYPIDAIISENLFWLRLMADHLKFICGLLDPSERDTLATTQRLSDKFDQLSLHARDFASILWHGRPNNDFIRFEKSVTAAAAEIREFTATIEEDIRQCALLTLIPPLLAGHMRRQAEHFLATLAAISEDLAKYKVPSNLHCQE